MKKQFFSFHLFSRILPYLLFIGVISSQVNGQISSDMDITGTVKDNKGEALIGVNVVEKGTSKGTITDIEGKFSINVSNGNSTLVFSYIGYTTQEIVVGSKRTINITLAEDSQSLDEVIVIGYGTMKKSDLTGAVARVSLEEKSAIPNVTLAQALSGTTAGVNIQPVGLAGGDAKLSIRGQTSLSANDDPLIVLDGIIYNGSITDININDVEYIDILKDASAAAVYGSRSANGVIIITTKKGKTEKPRISVNMYRGVQGMTNNPMKVMNADQYAIRLVDYYYQQDLYTWYKTNPTSDVGKPVRPDITNREVVATRLRREEEKENYLAGNEIDWVDQVMRDHAIIENYDVSVSGNGNRVNYYISGSYIGEEGILKNDQFKRYTFNSKVNTKITDWFSIGLNVNYSYRDYSGVNANLDAARKASPLANNDLSDPRKYVIYLTDESYMPHPLGYTKADNVDVRNNLFFVANAKIDIPFIKGLSYDFNYSNTYYNQKNNTFYPETIADGVANKGKAEKKPLEERNWIFNNIITYLRTFGDHSINATLLYSREKRNGESYTFTAEGFDNPALGFNNMQLGTKLTTTDNKAWQEQGVSYMGRINYQYLNRYMITGTVRRDGFSGFGSDQKFVTLPSVSLGWVLSEESFLNNAEWLYLKLRGSYGQNGNQGIGRYSSFAKMTSDPYVYGSSTSIGVYPSAMGNSSLAWEKTNSYNLGIDYALLNRRISGSIDVYTAKTQDVLVKRKLPMSTGYEEIWTNIGGINNKGIDIELKTVNIDQKNFAWNTGITFSLNRDKISKLYGGGDDKDIGNSWFVGEPISAIYDYKINGGLWTEKDLYSGNIYSGWYPGQYKYVDINKDNAIDPVNDRTIIGYKTPNYRFSISNTLTYKNFSLFFLINSVQGGNGYYLRNNYDVVNVSSRSDDVYRINQSAVRQYWTPENGVNNATGIYNSPAVTSGVYEDRSFVRLQDVSLTYTFDKKVLNYLGKLDNLQVYVAGKNLYTWTDWSGWDPEIVTDDSASLNQPTMRNLTVGLKLSF